MKGSAMLRFDWRGEGGPLRVAWREMCRASEIPGEYSLPDLQRRARAASGREDPESVWALGQYEALRQTLEGEKQALSRVFAASTVVFWGLALLTERRPRNRNLWAMLPVSGALTLGVGLRVWMVNALLRQFWERGAEE